MGWGHPGSCLGGGYTTHSPQLGSGGARFTEHEFHPDRKGLGQGDGPPEGARCPQGGTCWVLVEARDFSHPGFWASRSRVLSTGICCPSPPWGTLTHAWDS